MLEARTEQPIPVQSAMGRNRSQWVAGAAYVTIGAAVGVYALSSELTAVLAILLVAATAVLLFVVHPLRDLQAWLASLGVQFSQSWVASWRPALADLLLLPLALGTLILWWRQGRPLPRSPIFPGCLALTAAICGVGTLSAWRYLGHVPYRTLLAKDVGLLVLLAGLLCFILIVTTREKLHVALRALIVPCLVIQCFSLLSYPAFWLLHIPSQFTLEAGGVRLVGLLINPTAYGGYLIVVLLLLLGLLSSSWRILPRPVVWAGITIVFAGLVLTFSRSTWLAGLSGLLAMVACESLQVRRRGWRRGEILRPAVLGLFLAALFSRPLLLSTNAAFVAAADPQQMIRGSESAAVAPTALQPPDDRSGWRWTSEQRWVNDQLDEEARREVPPVAPPATSSASAPALAPPAAAQPPLASGRAPEPDAPADSAADTPVHPAVSSLPPVEGATAEDSTTQPLPAAVPTLVDGQQPSTPQPVPSLPAAQSPSYGLTLANAYMSNSEGLAGRVALDVEALKLVLVNIPTMLFGIGIGSFAEHVTQQVGYPIIIHNSYLWLFVETGVLGLIALLGILAGAVVCVRRAVLDEGENRQLAIAVLGGIVAMAVWMLANEGLYQRHFWVLLGLAHVLATIPAQVPGESTQA